MSLDAPEYKETKSQKEDFLQPLNSKTLLWLLAWGATQTIFQAISRTIFVPGGEENFWFVKFFSFLYFAVVFQTPWFVLCSGLQIVQRYFQSFLGWIFTSFVDSFEFVEFSFTFSLCKIVKLHLQRGLPQKTRMRVLELGPRDWWLFWSGLVDQQKVDRLTGQDVIFDILEPSGFQKYGICWVF